jgi:calcineurin-like phosphoesterase family protein
MSYVFFTSDTHFWHSNKNSSIIDFCQRPYFSIEHMNESLIKNWNERVKEEDFVFHLGDFGFGGRSLLKQIFNQLNGTIYLIQGNHDKNNVRINSNILSSVIKIGRYTVKLQHDPYTIQDYTNINFVICGHMHKSWKHETINGIIHINVGVDVWDYKVVRMDEVIDYYEKIKDEIKKNL